MRSTFRGAAIAVLLIASACAAKPSKDDCEKVTDHVLEVMMGAPLTPETRKMMTDNPDLKAQRLKIVDTCLKEMSKKDAECVLKATSEASIRACDD